MPRIALLLFICTFALVQISAADDSSFIFTSKVLPNDTNFMPTLGNGHISFTLRQHNLHMNGLYNGAVGESHRGRIPNWANIRMAYCDSNECEYTMDTRNGIFVTTLETSDYRVVHNLLVHRRFDRLVVNLFQITRLRGSNPISVKLIQEPGLVRDPREEEEEDDFDVKFDPTRQVNVRGLQANVDCGRTLEIEDPQYQKETRQLCVLWNHVPEEITLTDAEQTKSYKFIMSVDEKFQVAEEEMANGVLLPDETLLNVHARAWNDFWEGFDIKITGSDELAAAVHASMFYLANSLPGYNTRQPHGQYYGLSPSGLGRGGRLKDYQGHNFWDTESWMFPALNIIDPRYSKDLLSYRFNGLQAAMDNAKNTGFDGARFPWESGYTGREVTPPCCPEVVNYELHITADISYAMRLYFAVTHDYDWLKREGCQLSKQIAKFWASRATFNTTTRYYELNGVMGPDEDHENIDNNPFTNVVAGYALYFGEFTECICANLISGYQKDPEISKWVEIAQHLKLLYDADNDYHPQFEGYTIGTPIKQADTVLLGYPLEYKMDPRTRENDLKIYEPVTRPNGPAMTWGMHAINFLDNKDFVEAERLLFKSFREYMRVPFKVWCEVGPEYEGAINFITGAGGFLQVILDGYGGVRPKLGWLNIRKPRPLPVSGSTLSIEGLQFVGSKYNIYVDEKSSRIEFTQIDPKTPLKVIFEDGREQQLLVFDPLEITNDDGVKILPVEDGLLSCPVPKDTIGEQLPTITTTARAPSVKTVKDRLLDKFF